MKFFSLKTFPRSILISLSLFLTVLSFPLISSPQADVSGPWDLTVESPQGTANPSVNFQQDGERLTGSYRGRMGESRLSGTLKGNDIRFSVTIQFQEQSFIIEYSGMVEGGSMSGTAKFGESGTGRWSARRKS